MAFLVLTRNLSLLLDLSNPSRLELIFPSLRYSQMAVLTPLPLSLSAREVVLRPMPIAPGLTCVMI